jgi:integrase
LHGRAVSTMHRVSRVMAQSTAIHAPELRPASPPIYEIPEHQRPSVAKKPPVNQRKRAHHASGPLAITEGSVTVHVYFTPARVAGKVYDSWTLKYKLHGQPVRKQSTKLAQLIEEGRSVARRIANAQTAALTLTDAQVAEYGACRSQVANLKTPVPGGLLTVVQTAVETIQILNGKTTPQDAARYYLQRNKDITPISTAKLVEEFLVAKKQDGVGPIHLYKLKNNLGRFTAHFQCNLADVTGSDVQTWLRNRKGKNGQHIGAQTRLLDLRAVSNLCNYAKRQGYLPKTWDELANINTGILPETIIGTYTPAQLETILRGALGEIPYKDAITWTIRTGPKNNRRHTKTDNYQIRDADRTAFKQIIPYIVTGAFGGLRTAERCRTHWTDFNWETGFIHVTGKRTRGRTTRSSSRRLVPIRPTLKDWLADYIPTHGTPAADESIVPYTEQTAIKTFRLLCLAVGIEPIENGIRHSYISYRCAELKGDKSQVANEAGNSVGTINKHYLDLKTPTQAAAWFGIPREPAQNITPLKATA